MSIKIKISQKKRLLSEDVESTMPLSRLQRSQIATIDDPATASKRSAKTLAMKKPSRYAIRDAETLGVKKEKDAPAAWVDHIVKSGLEEKMVSEIQKKYLDSLLARVLKNLAASFEGGNIDVDLNPVAIEVNKVIGPYVEKLTKEIFDWSWMSPGFQMELQTKFRWPVKRLEKMHEEYFDAMIADYLSGRGSSPAQKIQNKKKQSIEYGYPQKGDARKTKYTKRGKSVDWSNIVAGSLKEHKNINENVYAICTSAIAKTVAKRMKIRIGSKKSKERNKWSKPEKKKYDSCLKKVEK